MFSCRSRSIVWAVVFAFVLTPLSLFGQAYQHAPVPLFRGAQYMSYSNILPAGKERLLTPTPQSDDFASGNQITAVGGTAEVNLDPANASDNTYTVHYFVSVTINAHSTVYGTAALVAAIETNDGSGWVERATFTYNCSYLSGPPPYAARTCSWSHEQKAITVTGTRPQ